MDWREKFLKVRKEVEELKKKGEIITWVEEGYRVTLPEPIDPKEYGIKVVKLSESLRKLIEGK